MSLGLPISGPDTRPDEALRESKVRTLLSQTQDGRAHGPRNEAGRRPESGNEGNTRGLIRAVRFECEHPSEGKRSVWDLIQSQLPPDTRGSPSRPDVDNYIPSNRTRLSDMWSSRDGEDYRSAQYNHTRGSNIGVTFPKAPQPSDSGYGTAKSDLKNEKHFSACLKSYNMQHDPGCPEKESNSPASALVEDCNTIYTVAISITDPRLANHINILVDDLSKQLLTTQRDGITIQKLVDALPGVLSTFALGLGYGASSQTHRDVMVFIHKFRRSIAETFNEHNNHDYNESHVGIDSDDSGSEILNRWLLCKDDDQYDALPIDNIDEIDESSEEYDSDFEIPGIDRYVNIVCKDPMYKWLLAHLSREALLSRANPDVMEAISEKVLKWTPSDSRISRYAESHRATVQYIVHWNMMRFLQEQEYDIPDYEAIIGVITLTGSCIDAQTATCLDYMSQTWPITGPRTLQLIQQLLKNPEYATRLELIEPSPMTLEARFSDELLEVRVSGLADFVAEIGEQLSWLGAAMRPSPDDCYQIAECTPTIYCALPSHNNRSGQVCEISFPVMIHVTPPQAINGQCWHSLWYKPVVAKGFPIPERPILGTGLEVPLPLMAALTRTQYINTYHSKPFLKGFSVMLVPTETSNDTSIVYWHMISSKHPEQRISYMDSNVETPWVSKSKLNRARHILGWCEQAIMTAGTSKADYGVRRSQLPKPRAGCALEKIEVSGGHDLEEDATATDSQRALRILTKKENRTIRLYLDRTEETTSHQASGVTGRGSSEKYYCLQDEVEHIYNTLEVLIDYQAEAESRSGLKIDPRPRRYLEGWDFNDIVSDGDPFFPRVATLSLFGKGWVDFTRSIRAITIFGRGFGELIRPKTSVDNSCPLWKTLPCGSYYLAAGVSDLKNIVERYDGNVGVNPIKICDGILWPVKPSGFRRCSCTASNGRGHHQEPVQALLPVNFTTKLKQRTPVDLRDGGAVIFGQSRSIAWFYQDEGDPVRGDASSVDADSRSSETAGSQSSTIPVSTSPSAQSSGDSASTPQSTISVDSPISVGDGMPPPNASQTKSYAGLKRGLHSSFSTISKRVRKTE
ncbi:uncharacterized protein PG998_014949 [Apiospora kogelbergensis]|uniref:uncharacterized protein n=1 Tax=Apiospora kogelbergensis TaxID=1337665 RepID=UPI00312D0CF4